MLERLRCRLCKACLLLQAHHNELSPSRLRREQTQFGYAVDFDASAQYKGYRVDFPALGELIYHLDVAARGKGIGIGLVVFDLQYLPRLLATPRGEYLRKNVAFMKTEAWVRHDDHIHVDFAVPCR